MEGNINPDHTKLVDFVVERIVQITAERGISRYRLSQLTGIAQSSLSLMLNGKTVPSLITLARICEGLGISPSEFFDDGEGKLILNSEEKRMLEQWGHLSDTQKKMVEAFIYGIITQANQAKTKE